jgi:hypothetical protein
MPIQFMTFFRSLGTSILAALLTFGIAAVRAASPVDPPASTPPAEPAAARASVATKSTSSPEKTEKGLKKFLRAKEGNVEELLQAIRALPAEKRQQLRENLRTWQNLSDGQRQQLRERESVLRKKAAEELSACLPDSKLSGEDHELLQKRYIEERRKLETNLRAEIDARRKAEVERLTEKFREELRGKASSSQSN